MKRSRLGLGAAVTLAAMGVGCARGAAVQTAPTLPLRRVVVYRNGVGYFERQGRVREREVNFRVAPSEVGDFLATLAVMEQGGSSVRAAAFPVPREVEGETDTARRTVRLALDGDDHDLRVGYAVETPVWRPSYRLVFQGDRLHVQAWGIVQNVSGEDWSDVSLSLVAGAPVSFRSELARAVIPPRPVVTDQGAVIDAVPLGDVTLAQGEPNAAAPSDDTGALAQRADVANAPTQPPALGLEGQGLGGGGQGEGTIGLGNIGTLGHGAGYGTGGGRLAERSASPQVRLSASTVVGPLSPEAVRRVALRNLGQVRHCYERALANNPSLRGSVAVRLSIAPTGAVSGATVTGNTLPDASVSVCAAAAGRRWTFPAPEGGAGVTATLSYTLAPVGDSAGRPTGGAPDPSPSSAPRSVAALAAVATQGGATRYDLPQRVTVPDHSATMVMLAAREVPGSRAHLFAPDPGVPASSSHPFHVARFENRTGALLERGPVAIFDDGAFLGQGMLETLPDAASATVPFALERAVSVEVSASDAVEGARLLSMQRDSVVFQRFSVRRSTYAVRNGLAREARVLLRHALLGAELFEPPAGTERGTDNALVPAVAPARGRVEVVVTTRTPFTATASLDDPQAVEAVTNYLRDGNPAPAVATALRTAMELRTRIETLTRERDDAQQRREDLQEGAEETRENLRAIQRNPQAADLRAQLTTRLARTATEVDAITRRVVELDTQISERRVRLTETLRGIEIDAATPPASTPAP
ncbi:MAG: AgmX/PglI C-terminal domain-containing protein [Polyangiales bacterium]